MSGQYLGVGATWQPHGRACYRINQYGRQVVVLPTHCPSGQHDLAQVGYAASEQDQILRVSCTACRAIPRPDHTWALRTGGQHADAAEFDDAPYARLLSQEE